MANQPLIEGGCDSLDVNLMCSDSLSNRRQEPGSAHSDHPGHQDDVCNLDLHVGPEQDNQL